MSEPWWIAAPERPPAAAAGGAPRVAAAMPRDLMRAIRARRPAFTPDWADPPDADAGGALVQLFAEQLATVADRAGRLPERAAVEFLNAAGIRLAPAQPARAVVQFGVAASAGGSVLVPDRFPLGAAGGAEPVVFETQAELYATPLEVTTVRMAERDVRPAVAVKDGVLGRPLRMSDRAGAALEIGLGGAAGVAAPGPKLSLGFTLAPAAGPTAVEAGVPAAGGPLLRWEMHTGNERFVPAGVVADGTRGLTQSGVVVLRPPAGWRREAFKQESAGQPGEPLFWLCARLVGGTFAAPPELLAVRANVVDARAVRTVRDEFLDPLDDPAGGRRRFRLRNAPVVPGSVVIEVERPVLSDAALSRLSEAEAGRAERGPGVDVWAERPTLAGAGPTDRGFVLDPRTGELLFGDGVTGAAVPAGVRNVRAVRYEVGGGPAGAVAAGAIGQLLGTRPGVTRVSNPAAATGGTAGQTPAEALRVGPRLVLSRGRAVAAADYEHLARSAPGADVRRALALAARHPARPGTRAPGVVGVWVVTGRRDGPPAPDDGTLRAVGEYLTGHAAPLGVRVVAAAPRFRRVRAEVRFTADPAADPGTVTGHLLDALDEYFDPLGGGDDGTGWPFGGPIRHTALVGRLFARVPALRAVTAVRLLLDGVPFGDCRQVDIDETDLLWPDGQTATPADAEDRR